MQEIAFRAMGCQMQALVDTDSAEAAAGLAQVPGWFEDWEQTLSRFRAGSELSRLNAMRGQAMPVSPVLWDVVDLAFDAARESGGLVSPTQLAALEAAGYDRSFDALAKEARNTAECRGVQLNAPAPDVSQAVTRNGQRRSLRLAQGVRLDLGGVAKGWAADETVERLSAFGPALMDAGGDIAVSGPRLGATPWSIGVANPFFPDDDLETLLLAGGGGLATSGRDYRRWQRNGRWYHHILDPRTGRPAETDVLTATVLAPTAARAEVAAKVALILGSQKGLAWLEARPELAGCLVLPDGRLARTQAQTGRGGVTPPLLWTENLEDALLALAPYAVGGLVAAAAVAGAIVVAVTQPAWLTQLAASLAGVEPKAYWYLSRSSAIVGYFMLWASMVLGLAITNKMARAWPGGPTFAALHEHTGWLGLVLSAFHALILLGDGYIGYNLNQLLIPFASANYRPLWVGLGQISLYLMAFVVLSFYMKRWISYRLWRTLHYLSFEVFVLGMLHGLMSGTDSAGLPMLTVYWASATSVVGLVIYRIRRAHAKARPQSRPVAA